MPTLTGIVYASGTITANGNSGYLNILSVLGKLAPATEPLPAIKRALVRMVPADLATDETLDVVLAMAFDSAGTSGVDIHTFTQVTATNVAENVILPGEDSAKILWADVGTANETGTAANVWQPSQHLPAVMPPYWKFTHTLGGTTKSMQYTIYVALEY